VCVCSKIIVQKFETSKLSDITRYRFSNVTFECKTEKEKYALWNLLFIIFLAWENVICQSRLVIAFYDHATVVLQKHVNEILFW